MTWRDWFTSTAATPEQRQQAMERERRRLRMSCSVWHAEDIDQETLIAVVVAETYASGWRWWEKTRWN